MGLVYKNLSWMRPGPEEKDSDRLPVAGVRDGKKDALVSRSLVPDWGKFPHPPPPNPPGTVGKGVINS